MCGGRGGRRLSSRRRERSECRSGDSRVRAGRVAVAVCVCLGRGAEVLVEHLGWCFPAECFAWPAV
jgi:hypothetical protein